MYIVSHELSLYCASSNRILGFIYTCTWISNISFLYMWMRICVMHTHIVLLFWFPFSKCFYPFSPFLRSTKQACWLCAIRYINKCVIGSQRIYLLKASTQNPNAMSNSQEAYYPIQLFTINNHRRRYYTYMYILLSLILSLNLRI